MQMPNNITVDKDPPKTNPFMGTPLLALLSKYLGTKLSKILADHDDFGLPPYKYLFKKMFS